MDGAPTLWVQFNVIRFLSRVLAKQSGFYITKGLCWEWKDLCSGLCRDGCNAFYTAESIKMDFEDIPAAEEEEYNNAEQPTASYSMPEPESIEEDALT